MRFLIGAKARVNTNLVMVAVALVAAGLAGLVANDENAAIILGMVSTFFLYEWINGE